MTSADVWSVFSDIYDEIVISETEIIEKIINNEITADFRKIQDESVDRPKLWE